MTKSEKKKKKAGALANLNPDLAFEVDDPMSNLKKAARNMRFQSDQVAKRSDLCDRDVFLGTEEQDSKTPSAPVSATCWRQCSKTVRSE